MTVFKKAISALPRTTDNATLQFYASVKSALEEINNSLSITTRGIVHANNPQSAEGLDTIAKNNADITNIIDTYVALDFRTPEQIQDSQITTTSGLTSILVSWSFPGVVEISLYEVWRSSNSTQANAVLVGSSPTTLFSDTVTPASTYYYWVRAISTGATVGPFNPTGQQGTSSADPIQALIDISGEITDSQLSAELRASMPDLTLVSTLTNNINQEIADRIAADNAEAVTRANVLAAEVIARTDADTLETNARIQAVADANANANALVAAEQTARVDGDNAEASQRNIALAQTNTNVGSNLALLNAEINARTTADSAETVNRQNQITVVDTATSVVSSRLDAEIATRATNDLAETTQRTNQNATLQTDISQNTADILAEQAARVNADSAEANRIDTVTASINSTATNALALAQAETTARVSANYAEATQTNSLLSSLDGRTSTVETNMETKVDDSTIAGVYTLKTEVLDANTGERSVAGFGLMTSTATPSTFIVNADKFAITATGTNDTTTSIIPFHVDTTTGLTTINSAYIPKLTADDIETGSLTSDTLNITSAEGLSAVQANLGVIESGKMRSSTADSSSRLIIDLTNEVIIVKDLAYNVRVRMGKLT